VSGAVQHCALPLDPAGRLLQQGLKDGVLYLTLLLLFSGSSVLSPRQVAPSSSMQSEIHLLGGWGATPTHRIPNLQLDLLAINVDHACTKLHADCQIMYWLEPFVCELQQ
jgi:hypothetical protein